VKENRIDSFNNFRINEADTNLAVETLKKKKDILDQIIANLKKTALGEMDEVLNKLGGAEKNPDLAKIIKTKKDQFDMDFLNAQLQYLEKSGDKTMVSEISKQRDAAMKRIETELNTIGSKKESDTKGVMTLGWKEISLTLKIPQEGGTTRYEITKSDSKKLVIPEGKTLFCDITGEIKKGNVVKLEKITIAGGGPLKILGKDSYETGKIEKITVDGKEVENYKTSEKK
jgi:hypothetical protein